MGRSVRSLTKADLSAIRRLFAAEVEEVVRKAVHDEFLNLGLATDSDIAKTEAQKDFAFMRRARKAVDIGEGAALKRAIGWLVTIILTLAVAGLGITGLWRLPSPPGH
jgi:hypothetical protein